MIKAMSPVQQAFKNMNFNFNFNTPAAHQEAAEFTKKMKLRKFMLIWIIIASFALTLDAQHSEFIPLFDGKSLEGWKVRSGSATYKVEDGTIVGTTTEGSGNTFLCTLNEYSDFVLEFEVKFDPELNSGVQFRSHKYDNDTEVVDNNGNKNRHNADRVYGYQFEIASEGSGGVYDEARRAVFISGKDKVAAPIKINEWNQCRIIAQGDHFRTFVNGAEIADFNDGADTKGFFGLQVHGIKKGDGPYKVRWRNILIRELKPGEKL